MCLGIPGQIVALFPGQTDLATVNISGIKRAINIALLENEMVKPGDWVLIHVGFAMAKMDEEEARASLAFLEEMGQAFTDEILALNQTTQDSYTPSPLEPSAARR
jgi:hydrogenase expression/formation protein HypC